MAVSTIDQSGLAQSQIISAVNMPTGSVIQAITSVLANSVSTTGTTTLTALNITITPTSSSSRFLLMGVIDLDAVAGGSNMQGYIQPQRNGSAINSPSTLFVENLNGTSNTFTTVVCCNYLDSPATSSAITYSILIGVGSGGTASILAQGSNRSTFTVLEIR
jgi:hypothetical protein